MNIVAPFQVTPIVIQGLFLTYYFVQYNILNNICFVCGKKTGCALINCDDPTSNLDVNISDGCDNELNGNYPMNMNTYINNS